MVFLHPAQRVIRTARSPATPFHIQFRFSELRNNALTALPSQLIFPSASNLYRMCVSSFPLMSTIGPCSDDLTSACTLTET
jgi:hypothetical protein